MTQMETRVIPDNGNNVIIHYGKHDTVVYACTVEVALALVEEAVPYFPDLAALAEKCAALPEGGVLRPSAWLVDALSEMLLKKEGESLPKLRTVLYGPAKDGETRPEVTLVKAWQDELVLWCFNHQFTPNLFKSIAPEALMAANPFESLTFLAGVKTRFPGGVTLVDGAYLDAMTELRVLRKNAWKPEAPESRVVSRYVSFLNDWAEGRWDILKIQQSV